MNEIFKKHKSGYYVSNIGRIRGKYVEFLKNTISPSGYETCSLGLVHRIVVETFISEIPENMEIDHINGIKNDNRLENLEIVSTSENQIRSKKSKKNNVIGENNPMASLTELDILDIYKLVKEGKTNLEISKKYFIHDRYVSLIRHGKRWNYLWKKNFNEGEQLISFGNSYYTLETMLKILELIDTSNLSDLEISNLINIDKSSISRIRNKKSWKDVWKVYLKNKNIATTIESIIINVNN